MDLHPAVLASSLSESHFSPSHSLSLHLNPLHSHPTIQRSVANKPALIIRAGQNSSHAQHQPLPSPPPFTDLEARCHSSLFDRLLGRLAAQLEADRTAKELHLERCLEAAGACDLATTHPPSTPAASPIHGHELRVAYQGNPGAYTEVAVDEAYPRSMAIPCQEFEAAFLAVESWLADRAVLPIENSLDGSIHRNYDLLLRHRLHIVGEVQWHVQHCLLTLPGVRKKELRRIVSHPQALSQCEQSILRMGLDVSLESVDDTTAAAQYLAADNSRDTAVIASAKAAEIFGLQILASDFQDDPHNVTRFLKLAREPVKPTNDRPYKTTVVFALEDGFGALCRAMSAFDFRGIEVTKLESRPSRETPLHLVENRTTQHWDYVFMVDIEASMASTNVQNAMRQLEEFSSFFRVLGSYPVDIVPRTSKPKLR